MSRKDGKSQRNKSIYLGYWYLIIAIPVLYIFTRDFFDANKGGKFNLIENLGFIFIILFVLLFIVSGIISIIRGLKRKS